jgi:hypothetical protein
LVTADTEAPATTALHTTGNMLLGVWTTPDVAKKLRKGLLARRLMKRVAVRLYIHVAGASSTFTPDGSSQALLSP